MDTLSKANLLKFIDYAITKGLVNANTGGGWKAACNKILEEYGPDDDLASVDVPSEVLRFNNRHPGLLSPDSLNQYQKRVQLVTSEFGKYRSSPTTYKGVLTRPASNGRSTEKRKSETPKPAGEAAAAAQPEPAQHGTRHVTGAATETSLAMPFPSRPTFLAQIIIPRDLSKDEAARLCNFIQALAQDEQANWKSGRVERATVQPFVTGTSLQGRPDRDSSTCEPDQAEGSVMQMTIRRSAPVFSARPLLVAKLAASTITESRAFSG